MSYNVSYYSNYPIYSTIHADKLITDDIDCDKIKANEGEFNDLKVNNNTLTENLVVNNYTTLNDASITNLTCSDATITNLTCSDATINDTLTTNDLNVSNDANINNNLTVSNNITTDTLTSNNITNSNNITTDTITSNNITNSQNITSQDLTLTNNIIYNDPDFNYKNNRILIINNYFSSPSELTTVDNYYLCISNYGIYTQNSIYKLKSISPISTQQVSLEDFLLIYVMYDKRYLIYYNSNWFCINEARFNLSNIKKNSVIFNDYTNNVNNGEYTLVSGYYNNCSGDYNLITGARHTINSSNGVLVLGRLNSLSSNSNWSLVAGLENNLNSVSDSHISGCYHILNNLDSSLVYGFTNKCDYTNLYTLLGGSYNKLSVSTCQNNIISGSYNELKTNSSNNSLILGNNNILNNHNNNITFGQFNDPSDNSLLLCCGYGSDNNNRKNILTFNNSGDMYIDHDLTVNNDTSINNDLTVNNDTSIGHNLTVNNDESIGNDLTVNNDASITNNVNVGKNIIIGPNNVLIPGNNVYDIIMGANHYPGNSDASIILGNRHDFNSGGLYDSICFGVNHIGQSTGMNNSIVGGNAFRVGGCYNSAVFGSDHNILSSDNALIYGFYAVCSATNKNNLVGGNRAKISISQCENNIISGNYNELKTTKSSNNIIIGDHNVLDNMNNSAVLGQYNNPDSSLLLSIGNGTADNARSNCFSVDNNGKCSTNGLFVNNCRIYAGNIKLRFYWYNAYANYTTFGVFTMDSNGHVYLMSARWTCQTSSSNTDVYLYGFYFNDETGTEHYVRATQENYMCGGFFRSTVAWQGLTYFFNGVLSYNNKNNYKLILYTSYNYYDTSFISNRYYYSMFDGCHFQLSY